MNILSISTNNFNRTRYNFNGKFEVTNKARKLIENICPADELIKSVQGLCSNSPADFLIKLEQSSKKELDKLVTGFQLSAYKSGNKLVDKSFIPANNLQDIECLIVSTDEMFQKLTR